MSKTALIGAPQVLAAAVIAVALAAVGTLAVMTRKAPEEPAPLAAVPAPQESAPAAAPAEPVVAAVEAPVEQARPAFDVVRVDAEGNATVAGRAAAGDQVALLLDGVEIASAVADGTGAFAFLATLPPAEGPRALSLQVTGADGTARVSETDAIVAPFAAPQAVAAAETPKPEETSAAAPAPTTETPAETIAAGAATETASVAEGATSGAAAGETVAAAPEAGDAATTEPAAAEGAVAAAAKTTEETAEAETADAAEAKPLAAPAVVMAGPQGIEVKQAPSAGAESLAIDAISYSDAGDVEIAGRAPGRGAVRVYLDNAVKAEAKIAADGTWRTALAAVDAGVYTLRVDEVDAAGKVLNRMETPFRREAPEALASLTKPAAGEASAGQAGTASAADQAPKRVQAITVQPGNTLWAIAQERYGSGMLYVRLFEANKGAIRDPDLIYPGQVFTIPE